MPEGTKNPTHYRLLSAFKAIGPYLREGKCKEGSYLFDCLAACVDDKKAPEKREFWGWWMILDQTDTGYEAKYQSGRYNLAGEWEAKAIPQAALSDVIQNQEEFHKKLEQTLDERFGLTLSMHEESAEFV
ncbi:sigma factor-binding protein Crl [Vibrio plantisponsor]|uniref:Sigma factor-binding protein Crl n=1 Tax=Vibrio plantisponsor TaxID=664643 RepID=A0ABU4IJ72_9VIBR|nr:sigma factor-binding protein Crl [Vibrio plantisponsor]MDW6017882.1 sigma factor-binding protein Crl [Vibrio plantisponsor]NNM39709.1 sigma factor-binding protein Crl [Vibrio plantisponsor]PNH89873.1 sigma factor-binding protein Crl [Vibrio diazotrophicus]